MDDHLLTEVKKWAAETGRTLTAIIEDALREAIARRNAATTTRKRIRLPSFRFGGLQPGIDLDNSASLWDAMDSEDAAIRR